MITEEKVTTGLLCRTCRQKTVVLVSKYEPYKGTFYHHSSVCENCGAVVCPTGVLSFILSHWEEEIKALDEQDEIRKGDKGFRSEQITIFEYLNFGGLSE